MPITKASGQAVAPAAKGDLVVGSATNDAAVLAVGSADQVLTVDSSTATGLKWATPSAGGMTLLSTTTLSSTATTVSSINQTYENLYVEVENATWNTANSRLQLELNSAGVTIFTQRLGAATVQTYNQATFEASNGSQDWSRTAGVNFVSFEIFNYAATNTYKAFAMNSIYLDTSDTAQRTASFFGGVGSSSAITSITIKFGGNTITGGTMKIYGVK